MGFLDTLLGNDAAEASKAAAADQYRKQQQAAADTRAAGTQYQSGMSELSRRFDPYSQAGGSAIERLMMGLGLTPGGSEAFTNAYRALPGYQSGLDTGLKAVTSRLNAGPGIQGGSAMKALQRYGSDYEDQRSGDYIAKLMSLGQTGLGATQMGVNTAGQGYQGQLQANLGAASQMFGAAPTIGQGDVAAAQAQATGLGNTIKLGMQGVGMLMGVPGYGSSFAGFPRTQGSYGGWTQNGGAPGWIS